MKSRSLAVMAILFALASAVVIAGCSQGTPPPPTVDNTNKKPAASVEQTLGVETTITVPQLRGALAAQGLKVKAEALNKSGLFLPAKFYPTTADGAFIQVYKFKNAKEAKGAAGTVEAGGFVLGATPDTLVNVNWTGWPAFFRSGDVIVIFVTEKGKGAHVARDTKVFKALQKTLGAPFMGGQTPPPGLDTSGTAHSLGSSATTL
jgi:hypothetical protein